ncbi:unnamed protein product [Moneuplotes crassus]|uniref:Trafficking protein particle complex subunit 13 middle domain-containing protein n=2 Tax=Euplotes crassus TaxID=5936 RepID=A0AAD1XND2_EUPCR|nr:unnamed protein product [Moneuplotes crassus]
MDKFGQLLQAKIKRLGKSTTVLDKPTFSSENKVGIPTSDIILTSNSTTIHPDAVKIGDKNFYVSEFGKVYTGEIFRGLIILSNKDKDYPLNNIRIDVLATYQNKNITKTLTSKTIPSIEKGGSFYQIVEIQADYTDTYVIEIKSRYQCQQFKNQLNNLNIDAMTPSQRAKYQNKESFQINFVERDVYRNFNKKFKFQTKSPFNVTQNTVIRKNKYFMEMTLENESTNLFLQSVHLSVTNPNLTCIDLNQKDEEDEIVGSTMKKKEIRSYLYIFEPKDGQKIKSEDNAGIGTVELHWQNIFGDPGGIVFGPFIYINETD